jgi:serine/threonine protein kinase
MPSKTCPSCRASYPADLEICPQDGNALESEGWLPRTIVRGKYTILRRVSEDEINVWYGVRVVESGEFRTVQVLRPGLSADASAVREFLRVGRVLQKVAHPNVLRVQAIDQAEDGRPFLVTEFIEAPSLAELVRDGKPLEAKQVCAMARGIAAALEACHRLGLLHLSLQPRHILVEGPPQAPRVKVQGFGTAHIRAARSRDGLPIGKMPLRDLMPAALAYSSPEQAFVRSPEFLDARSDLYSLGVLMYQMLAGRLPFPSPADGEDTALAAVATRLEEAPVVLAAPADSSMLPEPLAELVMQLLERRPELRPATARAVIDRIALAEDRIVARATLALEFPPPEVEPVTVHVMEGFSVPVASPPPPEEAEAVSAPPMPSQPVTGFDAAVLDSPAPPIAASGLAPASSLQMAEAPATAGPGAEPSPWTSPNSILFSTEPPARAVKRTRWVWATAAVLVVAAGAGLFIRRGDLQWHGPGPLSPLSSDQGRTKMGDGTTQSGSGVSEPPSTNHGQGAPSPPSQATSLPGRAEPSPGNPPASGAPQQRTAGTAGPPATHAPASLTASEVSGSEKPSPAQKAQAGSTRDEAMAEVNRAVAAGDVFFELGQYDLAVRTYEGPLKLDPNNKLLHSRIDRALKAKAAEQQFLGQ